MIENIKTYDSNQISNLLSRFLSSTLREIMALLNAECGSLFLFDGKTRELVLELFYNAQDLHLQGLRKRIGEGILGQVADIKMPVLVKDINRDLRFRRNGFNHYHTNSFISIPLFNALGFLGILNITDKSTGGPFSEKDLELSVTLCKYVCKITDNLLKFEMLKEEKGNPDKQKNELEKYASIGKLAASIVHQINNPLDGVIRYTNIILSQMDNISATREYLLEVKKGLNRIANITKSLLEFSHQVNSNTPAIKKYVDVHKLIDESLDLLDAKINHNIQVNKEYKEFLPRILDLGLQHAVINIIKNALDAMPTGGVLEISTDMNDGMVEISFKDTGFGIDNEIKNRIFEPFFTTKSIEKGTGLGLAICNEIISKYEGRIEVQSSLGQGSIFTVVIPKKYLQNA